MTKGLVSIIIVNWNGLEHLKKCLPSIFKQNYKKFEVILVDNGSSDNSVNWVRKNYPQIIIVKNKTNLGFAEGNNRGYVASKGDYVLFLNNDTNASRDFLEPLVSVLKKDHSVGGVQSKILFMDSPGTLDSTGSYLTKTGFLYHGGVYQKDSAKFNKKKVIYSAKGACMMFRRNVIEETLLDGEVLDSKFFAYFEETDLCHRVWLAGYRIMYVPESVIYHKFGASSIKLKKSFVEYHSYKNRINSYIKNLSLLYLFEILSVHIIICQVLTLIFVLRGKTKVALAIEKAILWNVLNLPQTLKKRSIIQTKIRKVKDTAFFPEIVYDPGIKYFLSHLKGWNVTQI